MEATLRADVLPFQQARDLLQAFVEAGAVQCGFCSPGLIVAAHDLVTMFGDPVEVIVNDGSVPESDFTNNRFVVPPKQT